MHYISSGKLCSGNPLYPVAATLLNKNGLMPLYHLVVVKSLAGNNFAFLKKEKELPRIGYPGTDFIRLSTSYYLM